MSLTDILQAMDLSNPPPSPLGQRLETDETLVAPMLQKAWEATPNENDSPFRQPL